MDTKEKIFKIFQISIVKISDFSLLGIRRTESHSEMEVLQMQTDMSEETRQANAEAIDTLIAISVVAKVLAEKLRKETKEGEPNEQNE